MLSPGSRAKRFMVVGSDQLRFVITPRSLGSHGQGCLLTSVRGRGGDTPLYAEVRNNTLSGFREAGRSSPYKWETESETQSLPFCYNPGFPLAQARQEVLV